MGHRFDAPFCFFIFNRQGKTLDSQKCVCFTETLLEILDRCGSFSWGYCSAVTKHGFRWIVDAHREGRRYIVESDELLSAFFELEQTLSRVSRAGCRN
jgi:hypothetical protein